jgi:uncharacterized DUF497 family protein
MIEFEWNEAKAASNQVKHGISFKEAKTAFFDERALQFFDDSNSILDEDRFLLLGMSNFSKLLLICHCERKDGEVIRIISARMATKSESKLYGDL